MIAKRNLDQAVTEYIGGFSEGVARILDELRDVMPSIMPGAQESYEEGRPAYACGGPACRFAVEGGQVCVDAGRLIPPEIQLEFDWAGYGVDERAVYIRPGQQVPVGLLRELLGEC